MLYLRLLGVGAAALAIWFAYGWGSQIIDTYNSNIAKVEQLTRDKALIESRIASKDTIIQRYKAAVAASQCKARIEYLIKNPDLLVKRDPFKSDGGN